MPDHANFGVVANAGNGRRWKKWVEYVENGLELLLDYYFQVIHINHQVDFFCCAC